MLPIAEATLPANLTHNNYGIRIQSNSKTKEDGYRKYYKINRIS